MKLIVGLGNPGHIYARNRHNIGFMCLNHFARKQGIHLEKKVGESRIGMGEIAGCEVILARPQTHMNSCGQALKRLVKRYNTEADDLIIIHDDLDLPLGKIRLRKGGSSGGHKGIESIIGILGNGDFYRIRVGIGRPAAFGSSAEDKEAKVIAHVLNDFTPQEKATIDKVIPQVSEVILCLLSEGLAAAMNKYN